MDHRTERTTLGIVSASFLLLGRSTRRPSLILIDIQLPGMDGLEATAVLKRDDATRSIPVIALTALAMKGDEERIRAAGRDGYVAKPLDYKSFLATITSHLASHSTRV